MNTSLDCMPCFMKMALRDARLACPGDVDRQRAIVSAWGAMIGDLDMTQPPPAIAAVLRRLIQDMSGCGDLYVEDKRAANARVMELLPGLQRKVDLERQTGGDPLALALELAIIGNYIDRGVDISFDWEQALEDVGATVSESVLSEFSLAARDGADVLVLGDNTGEIVLDTLLVRELQARGCRVTYAVRSVPVINDATMEDAESVGMTDLCPVVASGVDTPGTVLERCSPEFVDRMRATDVILSKGQGNFESLFGVWPDVYCAFKVKCRRVADESGYAFGASVFCRTPGVESHGAT